MSLDDLWTVEDPPVWMARLEQYIIGSGSTSLTFCIAIPPWALTQRFAYWWGLRRDAKPDDPLPKIIEVEFQVDQERRRLHSPRVLPKGHL